MGFPSATLSKLSHGTHTIEANPSRQCGLAAFRRPRQSCLWSPCIVFGLLGLVTLIVASPVAADSFFTRFSELEIVDGQELISNGREGNWHPGRPVDGTRLVADRDWRLVLENRIYWRPDADVVVLQRLHTSNACVGRHQFVLVPRHGFPSASRPSETCSNGIIAMRVSHEQIELDVAMRRPDLAHVTLRFDGQDLQEIEVPRDDSSAEIASAGPDVTRWVGRSPAALLDDPSERRRFETIMRREELHELVRNTYLHVRETTLVGDILITEGCRPHNCPVRGVIAIKVSTGEPYAMIYDPEDGIRVFGGALSDLPEPLRDVAQEWVP